MKKLAEAILTRPLLWLAFQTRKHPLLGLLGLFLVVFGLAGGFQIQVIPKSKQ